MLAGKNGALLGFRPGRRRIAIAIASRSPPSICSRERHFSLAFPVNWSDESSCANQAQKGFTTMKTAEASTTEDTAAVAEHAATVGEQGAPVAPEKASSKKGASQKKGAPKGHKAAKGGKAKPESKKEAKASKKAAKPTSAKEAGTPRAESKGAKILELISRPKGASLVEIQKATDWQAHSVRGFLSTAAKKHGLKIESTKTEAGDRVYQIEK
jgi:Protein of unknown function (DUF3489)